ncbi:Crp/Fnr family transcriptional regulator [Dysosmobacter sp.]|uniref:Crp/Fnr family transcriptional regulator n=1 Tax=Dysosmobacter sp. TaxID=2591382 RepID=UPI002A89FB36|nr:Crp/Fnr family transcriptional regulator [Dysosmobacter sp.]MDY3281883.1 Crp/Fnr family transcriptional regulator [Dysosmobacter sp.]
MLTEAELRESPLFAGIDYESYLAMYTCFQAVSRSYRPDDVIYDFSSTQNVVGIVERGEAALIRIDADGVETMMEQFRVGSVFGKTLDFSGSRSDVLEVVCRTPCEVLFFDYAHILKRCERACTHHSVLVQNMLRLMADKAQALTERVDVLSRRSIRDKLLCCFAQQRAKAGSDTFRLPFSLSVLADYIATDRSAMMRELKKMREEGLVSTEGRKITFPS